MAQYVYTMNRVGKLVPPKRVILKDISLSFFPGAKIGVLGLNGSGKSSLLRIMAGEDREYELRAPADWNPTGRSVERFDDALTAFQRHAMIERTLLDAGWQLDGFESEKVTLH
jgi:ATPase subunit of ABC transporter with duplicated ATPase domains